jgi:hypothetical protein
MVFVPQPFPAKGGIDEDWDMNERDNEPQTSVLAAHIQQKLQLCARFGPASTTSRDMEILKKAPRRSIGDGSFFGSTSASREPRGPSCQDIGAINLPKPRVCRSTDVVDPIGPAGDLRNHAIYRLRNDPGANQSQEFGAKQRLRAILRSWAICRRTEGPK